MNKPYFHKLTNKQVRAIPKDMTCSKVREMYRRPRWCMYPDAIDPFGCWSLIGANRKKISKKFCATCTECSHYSGAGYKATAA